MRHDRGAPSVSTSERKEQPAAPVSAEETVLAAAQPSPELTEVMSLLRRLRKHVEENAENVGTRFAEEARKIHYEEADRRAIYGEASLDDARALVEEGIEIHALPRLPDDAN